MVNLIGKQLGNYTLTQLLGQGGFAEVYLGEHIYLKAPAAIKVLHAQLSGPEDTESFQREAQTVARLIHPNIIRVLDFGIAEQIPFLVMDYAAKGTLRQRHPRGTHLPLTTILPYVKQVASALQYAHDERLIHRDIKPENMLLGLQGNVLLSDFGIALVAQSSRNQNTQDVTGTVAYMSPEQIQGKPRPASDQYSLAIVIYEWLTGERPFNGTFTELCTQHMFAPIPPLREKVADISPHVEEVITTALAKDYHQRFGSVKAFANALEQASQEQPSAPLPTSVISSDQPTLPAQPDQSYMAAQSGQHPPSQVRATLPQEQHTPAQTMPPSAQPQNVTPPAAFMPPNNSQAQQAQGAIHQRVQESRPSAWGLTNRQCMAMLIGAPLCAIMGYVASTIQGSLFTFVFAFSFALIYFFGTKYGPWVGMVVSLAAAIVEYFFIILYPLLSLYEFCMFNILLSFVASLAFIRTRGNYRGIAPIAFAVGTSLAGLALFVVGTSFASLVHDHALLGLSSVNSNIPLMSRLVARDVTDQVALFTGYVGSGLIGLALLAIALLLSNLFDKADNTR